MDLIKVMERPTKIIDTSLIKTGDKIYYKERMYYSDSLEEMDYWTDEGEGEILEVDENAIVLIYNGYESYTQRVLDVEMLDDNCFYSLELLHNQ